MHFMSFKLYSTLSRILLENTSQDVPVYPSGHWHTSTQEANLGVESWLYSCALSIEKSFNLPRQVKIKLNWDLFLIKN